MIALSASPNSDEFGKQSLYPDGDLDHRQNLTICSLAHCQPSLKMSCKSIWKFLRKIANRQTDKQTDKQRQKHNLLGSRVITYCPHSLMETTISATSNGSEAKYSARRYQTWTIMVMNPVDQFESLRRSGRSFFRSPLMSSILKYLPGSVQTTQGHHSEAK